MRRPRTWPLWIAAAVILGFAVVAGADLPCQECPASVDAEALDGDQLLSLVATTVFEDGLSLLLLGAFAVVGMPWFVAAVAIAAIYVPRWLRASR